MCSVVKILHDVEPWDYQICRSKQWNTGKFPVVYYLPHENVIKPGWYNVHEVHCAGCGSSSTIKIGSYWCQIESPVCHMRPSRTWPVLPLDLHIFFFASLFTYCNPPMKNLLQLPKPTWFFHVFLPLIVGNLSFQKHPPSLVLRTWHRSPLFSSFFVYVSLLPPSLSHLLLCHSWVIMSIACNFFTWPWLPWVQKWYFFYLYLWYLAHTSNSSQ